MRRLLLGLTLIFIEFGVMADKAIELADDVSLTNLKKQTGYWTKFGAAFCRQEILSEGTEKNYCLSLEIPADAPPPQTASWKFNTRYEQSFGRGEIQVSFRAKMEAVKSLKPNHFWSCFHSFLIGHIEKNGKREYKNFKGLQIGTGTKDWTEYRFNYMLPSSVTDISVSFTLSQCTGKVLIDDLSIKFIPADKQSLAKAISARVMGGKVVQLLPERRCTANDQPFVATKAENQKGYVVFRRENLRDTYPYSIPSRQELVKRITLFATPGEKEPAWLEIYSLKKLENIAVSISALTGSGEKRITQEAIEVKLVHYWPQGTTASAEGNDNTYSIIPELLLPSKKFSVSQNTTAGIYFLVSVPEKAAAGIYKGKITIKPGNAPASETEFVLRVLPFRLEKPAPERMVWLVHNSPNFKGLIRKNFSAEDAAAEACRDFKNHGIDGLSLPCVYGSDTIRLTKVNGKLRIADFKKLKRIVPAMVKAGMKGPLIIHFGDLLEYQVAKAMNYELPAFGQKGGVSPAMNDPAFKQSCITALQEVDKLVKALGGGNLKCYFMGIDEPGDHHTRQERAFWEWALIRKAGFQGAAYMHGPFWKELAPLNYVQIFTINMYKNRVQTDKLLEEVKQYKNIPFQYGGSGCYGRIPGGLMPSRWGTGFFAYVTKIRGQVSWIYTLHRNIDPEGTAQLDGYPTLTYADKAGNLIPTLQWEGIREGIDDYCYLTTLEKRIKNAKEAGGTSAEKAEAIEKQLQILLEKVPFNDNYGCGDSSVKADFSNFSNATASILRWQIALWTMELPPGGGK
ncbi:MAG: hypothetical protein PHH77_11915 [Victivallaceae bacterium]|nr:hypothetical protein [Victivallaceae bacterium]